MPPPSPKPRRPMRVAIAALAVSLAVMAALIVFLIWGRSAPTVAPAPSPSVSSTPSFSATPSPSAMSSASATPTQPPSEPVATTSHPSTTATPVASPSPPPGSAIPAATTSTPASPATTEPPAPSTSPGQTMRWEGRATFEHFTVEVLSDDAVQDAEIVEDKAGLLVEVCVSKALDGEDGARVTTDPWTLEESNGNIQTPQQPGYKPAFPAGKQYPVGKCARGFLTFDFISTDSDHARLVYDNGLGDRAVWQFH